MTQFRKVFLAGFLICFFMLAVAGYFQFVEHLEPCNLCILQRVMVLPVGIVFLLGFLHDPYYGGRRVYGFFVTFFALLGGAISARHVWIQNLPAEQVPGCTPGLDFILDNFPLSQAIEMVLSGSGECAEVLWTWWGLTIPGWTLVAFIVLALMGLSQLFCRMKLPK